MMKRGASSSRDVASHWDAAPEEMAMDDEGSVQLTPGQERTFGGVLPWRHESSQSLRSLPLSIAGPLFMHYRQPLNRARSNEKSTQR